MTSQVQDRATPPAASASGRKQSCASCRRPLPIAPQQDGAEAAEWQCEACSAPLTGVLTNDIAPVLAERIRLAQRYFDSSRGAPISPTLRQLVAEFLQRRRAKQDNHERRRNPRAPCDLDAVGIAMDDLWTPQGEPFNAVVIDLAAHGLGMMTPHRVNAPQLAIQIQCPAGLVQLLGRTAWSNQVGETFQNTGVEFTLRLGRTTISHDDSVG